jgi:Tat protein secretion system quality control protein TatD with DNase activity
MLVNLVEILRLAEEKKCAVGAFNTPNLECINAVLNAAERLNVPVILSHAELHEPVAPLSVIGPVMVEAAKKAKVPVCVHLDHCETLSYMQQALDIGFTGVITFKNARKPLEALRSIPPERLLLETDCPYMAPVPYRGQRCDSTMLTETAAVMAREKGFTVEEMCRITAENAIRLFRIADHPH